MNNMKSCRKKKSKVTSKLGHGACPHAGWHHKILAAAEGCQAGLFPSTWLRACVQWSITRGAHSWSSVTRDIKNEGFFFYLSPASIWHFPGSIACLAPAIASYVKKTQVCKHGFVNYGKPTAGGSHSLGSCRNYQPLLEKGILLWESHCMSVLCEMSFPRLCKHFYTDFVMGWTGLPHIQTVPLSRRELLPIFPLPLAKLWLWTGVSVAIYKVVEREKKD